MKPYFLYIRLRMKHNFQLSGIASDEATQVLIYNNQSTYHHNDYL